MSLPLSRRTFLQGSLAAIAAGCAPAAMVQQASPAEPAIFFLISDTHLYAPKEDPTHIDDTSMQINERLIDLVNKLPGVDIPESAGGGKVRMPAGVLHGGDCIDSGDKNGAEYTRAQQTELDAFIKLYGLTGREGRLKYPLYEIHGNHDSPGGEGMVIDAISQRNKTRPGLASIAPNGLHYSWNAGPAHFVNLGITVAPGDGRTARRRFNPRQSLEFLEQDLKQSVGATARPVVLMHHCDVARHVGKCDPAIEIKADEWDPCETMQFYKAIQGYNVAAILYGHTHARNAFQWAGAKMTKDTGVSVFNVGTSSHYKAARRGFFYIEVSAAQLAIRECFSTDGWQTWSWSDQPWIKPIAAAKG